MLQRFACNVFVQATASPSVSSVRTIHPLCLLVSALLLAACSGSVTLRVDRARYRVGQTLRLELENHSSKRVLYNLCGPTLERKTIAGWLPLKNLPPADCVASLRELASSGRAAAIYKLPPTLSEGRYRLVTRVESPAGHSKTVSTKPFQISP